MEYLRNYFLIFLLVIAFPSSFCGDLIGGSGYGSGGGIGIGGGNYGGGGGIGGGIGHHSVGGGHGGVPPSSSTTKTVNLFGLGIGYQKVISYKPVLLMNKGKQKLLKSLFSGFHGGGGGGNVVGVPVPVVVGAGGGHDGYGSMFANQLALTKDELELYKNKLASLQYLHESGGGVGVGGGHSGGGSGGHHGSGGGGHEDYYDEGVSYTEAETEASSTSGRAKTKTRINGQRYRGPQRLKKSRNHQHHVEETEEAEDDPPQTPEEVAYSNSGGQEKVINDFYNLVNIMGTAGPVAGQTQAGHHANQAIAQGVALSNQIPHNNDNNGQDNSGENYGGGELETGVGGLDLGDYYLQSDPSTLRLIHAIQSSGLLRKMPQGSGRMRSFSQRQHQYNNNQYSNRNQGSISQQDLGWRGIQKTQQSPQHQQNANTDSNSYPKSISDILLVNKNTTEDKP